jgi:peptidoglycan/LPS O-acetylase OafA/YrhL
MLTDSADGQTAADRVDRVASLTGMRAVAAFLVVGTHAAFGTGMLTHGYLGLALARLEIGVSIFFVLSGFLLFRPWVQAAANGQPRPSVPRYARNRVRRIMPAYVVTVLAAYLLYEFRTATPNPGHTWSGLLRHLTLTQIYSNDYLSTQLHQGLTQMWSLAVEAAFYLALPALAYGLLIVLCRGRWRPGVLLVALSALVVATPLWLLVLTTTDWLPNSAGMWLPSQLMFFAGGMLLAVLQAMGVRCHALAVIPVVVVGFLIVSTPIAGAITTPIQPWQPLVKATFYGLIATLAVAPLALGSTGAYARLLGSRPMVWLGGISYEIFLLHVMLMEIAMTSVLRWQVFTGSMPVLVAVTLALTIPLAWLLRRFSSAPSSAPAADTRWSFPRRPSHPRTAASPEVPHASLPDSSVVVPILRPAGAAARL